jgi:putative phosphoesterase
MQDKIAIVSDIHSNHLALEAVIEDIEKNNIAIVLNLGDSLYGPMNPEECFKLISDKKFISISGNQDRFILEHEGKDNHLNSTLTFVLNSLSQAAFNWIRTLKKENIWKNIYMCHGNLHQDDVPLLESFYKGEVKHKSSTELERELKHRVQDIILCGHTHIPRIVSLFNNSKFIINPGSIGLPAYDDHYPFYHKMESDTPLAKYSIVEFEGNTLTSITQRHIKYDYERAAQQAEKNDRPDWAYWIRYGKVK